MKKFILTILATLFISCGPILPLYVNTYKTVTPIEVVDSICMEYDITKLHASRLMYYNEVDSVSKTYNADIYVERSNTYKRNTFVFVYNYADSLLQFRIE